MPSVVAGTKKKLVVVAVAVSLMTVGASAAFAAGAFTRAAAPTSTQHHVVLVGGGQKDDYVNLQYTPNLIDIYAGDSVTFKSHNPTEPHTVTFGPKKMIKQMVKTFITPVPSGNGPPVLQITTAAVQKSASNVVLPGKFVNSGVLSSEYHGLTKTKWTAKFPMPGKYEFFCLIHGTFMHGWVVVHARPGTSSSYQVEAGPFTPNPTAADVFFPDKLTVHVGDTVTWSSFFHTVTFGPMSQIVSMRHQFVIKSKDSQGKPLYQLNPQVAFPSAQGCGTPDNPCAYSGGFLSSGLLQGGQKGPATWSIKFMTAGKFTYGCLVHPGMDATITVLPAQTGKG